MILKLAFRNILKYKRRTITVFFSILFSVFVFVFVKGFIDGFNNMFMDLVVNNLGHVTVQHEDYEKKADLFSIDYLVNDFSRTVKKVKIEGVREINGTLRFGGILSSETESIEMIGRGIEIEKRGAASNFRKTIKKGTFLEAGGQICISAEIAELLDVDIGNKLMVLSTNSYGGFDVIELEVAGLFDTGISEENENIFIVGLQDTWKLLRLQDTVSSIEIKLVDFKESIPLTETLNRGILKGSNLKAYSWEETRSEVKIMISLVGISMTVMFIVIVAVVGTGIINSILMSVFERFKDFGTIRAIGFKKRDLFFLIITESIGIGMAATGIGIFFGGLITILLSKNGIQLGAASQQIRGFPKILYPDFNLKTVFLSSAVGILISAFGAVMPAISAFKLKIVDIMRHN